MEPYRNSGANRRKIPGALAGLSVAFVMTAGGAWASPEACRVPDAYLSMPRALERTQNLIISKSPVRVIVLGPLMGSLSEARSPLELALERRLPGVNFEIMQALSPGLAEDDFTRLRSLVRDKRPDLVIWQVGVPDALAANPIAKFENTLDAASTWMEKTGPDLVLVDPPFVPQVRHERIYTPYIGGISDMQDEAGVPVVRRYAAMQYLVSEAQKSRVTHEPKPCMPELMAEAIVRAVRK